MAKTDKEALQELMDSAPPQLRDRYDMSLPSNQARRKKWLPVVKPTDFMDSMEKAGVTDRAMQEHLQICCENSLDQMEQEIHSNPYLYDRVAQQILPRWMSPAELKEATANTNIAAFRKFAFPLVREIWPALAPVASMISMQTMPLPSSMLFYMKNYYTDAGDFYSAAARMVNDNDPGYSDYACGTGAAVEPREVEFRITSTTVDAEAKALLGRTDLCTEQDIQAYHGLSWQNEISRLMAIQIAREWNGKVRDDLIGSANGGTATWYTTAAASSEYTLDSAGVKAWQETLFESVADVEELVYNKRYRNLGWLWTDPATGNRMRKASNFEFRGDAMIGGMAEQTTRFYGVVNGLWRVFVDPDMTANTILCGVTPATWLETGYLFASYVPISFTDRFMDPEEMAPRLAAITRAGRKLVDGAFYGKVNITARP